MAFSKDVNRFIKAFVKSIDNRSAAVFVGAGLSIPVGYADWKALLRDIAVDLDLEIEREDDLISLAQFHVTHRGGPQALREAIIDEFSRQSRSSESHKILARLPIETYWTTNYDTLIEDSLKTAQKVVDKKHQPKQLSHTTPKRDAVLYKMHGDVDHPDDAILYKHQYERYHLTHQRFVTALSADLLAKTFLFVGFSFNDPNIEYVLSRLHGDTARTHYCIMRRTPINADLVGSEKAEAEYRRKREEYRIKDLQRYGIQTVQIDEYSEIPLILAEIEKQFKTRTVFISGSAHQYGDVGEQKATAFIHKLSDRLIKEKLTLVSGFGLGIGSAVINGALTRIYDESGDFSETQLILRPFPQFATEGQNLQALWHSYRNRMLSICGISIIVFGNKLANEEVVIADGVKKEFDIGISHGVFPIPISQSGFAALDIFNRIKADPTILREHEDKIQKLEEISKYDLDDAELINKIVQLILILRGN